MASPRSLPDPSPQLMDQHDGHTNTACCRCNDFQPLDKASSAAQANEDEAPDNANGEGQEGHRLLPIATELSDFFHTVQKNEFSSYAMVRLGKILCDLGTVAAVSQQVCGPHCHPTSQLCATPVLQKQLLLQPHTLTSSPSARCTLSHIHSFVPCLVPSPLHIHCIPPTLHTSIYTVVCCQVRGTPQTQDTLSELCKAGTAWKTKYTHDVSNTLGSFRGCPLLAQILDNYWKHDKVLPESFWPFVQYLLRNSMRSFPDEPELKKWERQDRSTAEDPDNFVETKAYQTTGHICPYKPRLRPRGYYDGYDQNEEANACRHRFLSHRKKTGGLMSHFCPHSICQGSNIIVNAEGRKDAYRFLFCRLERAPEVVVYVSQHFSIPRIGCINLLHS